MKKNNFPFLAIGLPLAGLTAAAAILLFSNISHTYNPTTNQLSISDSFCWVWPVVFFMLSDSLILIHMLCQEPRRPLGIIIPFSLCFFLAGLFYSLAAYHLILWFDLYAWANYVCSWYGYVGPIFTAAYEHKDASILPVILFINFSVASLCLGLIRRRRPTGISAAPDKQVYRGFRSRNTSQSTHSVFPEPPVASVPARLFVPGQIHLFNSNGPLASCNIYNGQSLFAGRDSQQCQIILPSEMNHVSRIHLEIIYDANQQEYQIKDVSSQGTFVLPNLTRLPKNTFNSIPPGTTLQLATDNCFLQLL